jgi:predicted amino acid dehydrogenase
MTIFLTLTGGACEARSWGTGAPDHGEPPSPMDFWSDKLGVSSASMLTNSFRVLSVQSSETEGIFSRTCCHKFSKFDPCCWCFCWICTV